ncbi:MAG: hypothetical protein GX443_11745 [Deltaproteobacteria bacterium]|nr:hypothetical protein [Deltaproteobacteria bacterium]
MTEESEILSVVMDLVGEEGCGVSCSQADVFRDEDGWKLMMEGFMEPWRLGETVSEARETLKELASMGFGLA